MIIAIDGPAGAGKSTTARALAQTLNYAYIDTGAMYRAVALAALENALHDDDAIIELSRELPLRFEDNGTRIFIGEREVSSLIRSVEIGARTSQIAAIGGVREAMVAQQRRIGRDSESNCGGAVLEGRDIQTVVFPDAPIKIFLTADAGTRAGRRLNQWDEKTDSSSTQQSSTQEDAERDIRERDARDSSRTDSPLKPADDAVFISTDNLSPEEVVAQIVALVREHGA